MEVRTIADENCFIIIIIEPLSPISIDIDRPTILNIVS